MYCFSLNLFFSVCLLKYLKLLKYLNLLKKLGPETLRTSYIMCETDFCEGGGRHTIHTVIDWQICLGLGKILAVDKCLFHLLQKIVLWYHCTVMVSGGNDHHIHAPWYLHGLTMVHPKNYGNHDEYPNMIAFLVLFLGMVINCNEIYFCMKICLGTDTQNTVVLLQML